MTHRFVTPVANLVALVLMPWLCNAAVPDINPALLGGMKWRQIGPFRGGRVVAVSGVPGDPDTWYFGGVAGGVWKSTDVGASWKPMFDDQKIASGNPEIGRFFHAPVSNVDGPCLERPRIARVPADLVRGREKNNASKAHDVRSSANE